MDVQDTVLPFSKFNNFPQVDAVRLDVFDESTDRRLAHEQPSVVDAKYEQQVFVDVHYPDAVLGQARQQDQFAGGP